MEPMLKIRYRMQLATGSVETFHFNLSEVENHKGLNTKSLMDSGIKILSRDICTNLKDHSGVDIYENDMVKREYDEDAYKVIFWNGGFWVDFPSGKSELFIEAEHLHIVGTAYDYEGKKSFTSKIVTSPKEMMSHDGVWDKYCKLTGMNPYAVNEGMSSDAEIVIPFEMACAIGLFKGCLQGLDQ